MLRSSTTLPFQFIRDGMFSSEKPYVLFSGHVKDALILDYRPLTRWQPAHGPNPRLLTPQDSTRSYFSHSLDPLRNDLAINGFSRAWALQNGIALLFSMAI